MGLGTALGIFLTGLVAEVAACLATKAIGIEGVCRYRGDELLVTVDIYLRTRCRDRRQVNPVFAPRVFILGV